MKFAHKVTLVLLLLQALAAHATTTVTNIATGYYHSLFLKSDGSLWAMGNNVYGELGDGTYDSRPDSTNNRPEEIVTSGVTAIATGASHSLFLKSDGSLWAMGNNYKGQLGDGTYGYPAFHYATNQPEEIVASGVTAVAAGAGHSLFLKSDGSLWAMGSVGELDSSFNNTNHPEQIIASGVTAITTGASHILFLKSDGSLWAMGNNQCGQLGDGTFNNTNRPEQIVASGVTAIAAGEYHSLFLESNGSLWAMGNNYDGELGDGTFNNTNRPEEIIASSVTAVAAGAGHSLFLKSDGSLWAMGYNFYGQLGDGFIDSSTPYGTTTPEQIFPLPQPILHNNISSQTNVQFNASCGFGDNFYLLGNTNIALPLSQWTPLWTNSVTVRGTNNFSVIITNAVNFGRQQFYILQSQ